MPRIIIFAPSEQDKAFWFAEKMAEADPQGVVVVTADFNMEQAVQIVSQMQLLTDENEPDEPCQTSQGSPE